MSNRLGDAESWLKKAIGLRGGEADPKIMLAEVYYRRDDFEKAAAALDGVDSFRDAVRPGGCRRRHAGGRERRRDRQRNHLGVREDRSQPGIEFGVEQFAAAVHAANFRQ